AERRKLARRDAVLVKSRGEADRVFKAQSEARDLAERLNAEAARRRAPQRPGAERERQSVQCQLVCRLRRELEQEGAQQRAIEHRAGRSSPAGGASASRLTPYRAEGVRAQKRFERSRATESVSKD